MTSRLAAIVLFLLSTSDMLAQLVEEGEDKNLAISLQTGNRAGVHAIAFSKDARYMVAGSNDNKVVLWQLNNGKQVREFSDFTQRVNSLAFNPDGKTVAIGDEKNIVIWDPFTGKIAQKLTGLDKKVLSMAYLNSDYLFTSADEDRSPVMLWNLKTGKVEKTFSGTSEYPILSIVVSPDGKYLYGGAKYDLKVWDISSGTLLKESRDFQRELTLSVHPQFLIAEGKAGEVVMIDPITLKSKRKFMFDYPLKTFSISPDASKIGVGHEFMAAVRSAEKNKQLFENNYPTDTFDPVTKVVFTPDSRFFIVCGIFDEIKMYDASSGKLIREFKGYVTAMQEVTLDSTGTMVFMRPYDYQLPKRLLDLKTGSCTNHEAFGPMANRFATYEAKLEEKLKQIKSSANITHGRVSDSWASKDGIYLICAMGYKDELRIAGESNSGKVKVYPINKGGTDSFVFDAHHSQNNDRTMVTVQDNVADLLVTGSQDHTAKVFDLKLRKEIATLRGHSYSITSVAITPDKKRIIVSSFDGNMTIWDAKSFQLIATFLTIGTDEYAITTPDNYYMASKGAQDGVAFRAGMKTFSFEQFDLLLNRPDIVLARIGYSAPELISAYNKAYLKRLKKMNFTEEMLSRDFHLPEIQLTETEFPIVTNTKQFTFNISAKDSKYLLDRINVYVNEVPVYSTKGIDLRSKSISEIQQAISIELTAGVNKINVSVINEKGAESLKESIEIRYEGPLVKPDLYVLSIGISDYSNNEYDLKYASKDATDLANLLESKKESYAAIHVKRILDKDATRANILQARTFLESSKVDDQVIVFVAGHGLLDGNLDYFIATTDVDFNNPAAAGLKYESLEGLLDGIQARKKLMLIDACHSGEVDKEETEVLASAQANSSVSARGFKKAQIKAENVGLNNSFSLMQELFSDLRKGTGTIVISSASGVEFAFESSEWQNGVFTYALLDGLKSNKADKDKNNEVVISELRDYVINRVEKLTNGNQHPTSRKENLEFDFKIW